MKLTAPFISLLLAANIAAAGGATATAGDTANTANTAPRARQVGVAEAQSFVDKSVHVIDQMKSDPGTAALLRKSRGVLIVPDYLQAALIVGGRGGVGVLMDRHAGRWSGPAFFSISGLSVGLQAGGDAGAVAYLLMTQRALKEFENRSGKFSLGADAGLTVASLSSSTNIVSTLPTADVIVWTATTGLFGGVAFDATDVASNFRLDQAYYHQRVSMRRILDNSVHNRLADRLQMALGARVGPPQ
ncbi:MAG: lipid-binding SYLF domain-containing protein [Steroidobacteraceae bacterium]